MPVKNILSAATIGIALSGQTLVAAPVEPFTGFVGFGDSLSDKGRGGPYPAPAAGGRFSDGPTWMEHLGAAFETRGQGNFNMALGGATAGPDNLQDPRYNAYDVSFPPNPADPDDIALSDLRNLSSQVDAFVNAGFDQMVGDNPLITILIGANDFLQNASVNPFDVIGNISAGIRQIAGIGTSFDSFMIATMPDFSVRPSLFYAPDAVKADIRAQTMGFNYLLSMEMAALDTDPLLNIDVEIFDLFSAADTAYTEAEAKGLILDDTCVYSIGTLTPHTFNNCTGPEGSSNYLFMDDVHPGVFAHERWGAAAVAQVSDRLTPMPAPVPLPAGLPLLLGGVGLLALMRRRNVA